MATWDGSALPERVREVVQALGERLRSSKPPGLLVGLREAEAHLELRVELESYPRAAVAELAREVEGSGGRLVELWRLPRPERDELRARTLAGGQPVVDYASAAQRVAEHLQALANGRSGQEGEEEPLALVEEADEGEEDMVTGRIELPPERPEPLAAPAPVAAGPAAAASSQDTRRRGRRFAVRLEMEFRTELEFVREHATNISNGGLFVRTAHRPPLDSVVRVQVKLPNGQRLEGEAVVVHVLDDPYRGGVGVAFISEDPIFSETLDRYLLSLADAQP